MTKNAKQNSDGRADSVAPHGHQTPKPNALWFKIVMFGLMVIGLLWIIVFYISFDKHWPIPSIGNWNILVGFGILMAGFLMTTRWRS